MNDRCARCAKAAPWVSSGGNAFIAAAQWYVGLSCGSQAVIADATHTTLDLAGSLVAWVSLRLSRRRPTARYPYGLRRLEDASASASYLVLIVAGTAICINGGRCIVSGDIATPSVAALIVTMLSIVGNALMYYFLRCAGHRANSPAVIALSWDNRADSMTSVAALIGVGGAVIGFRPLDPLAAITVGALIVVGNVRNVYRTANRLVDSALPKSAVRAIERAALTVPFVKAVLGVRTRDLGMVPEIHLDVLVDGDVSVEAAAQVADAVAERVRLVGDDTGVVRVYVHPGSDVASPRAARLTELITAVCELKTQEQRGRP